MAGCKHFTTTMAKYLFYIFGFLTKNLYFIQNPQLKNKNNMQDFQWVGKSIIGFLGSMLSIALEDALSVAASVSTIIFIIYNIRYVRAKLTGVLANNKHQSAIRKQERNNNAKSG